MDTIKLLDIIKIFRNKDKDKIYYTYGKVEAKRYDGGRIRRIEYFQPFSVKWIDGVSHDYINWIELEKREAIRMVFMLEGQL